MKFTTHFELHSQTTRLVEGVSHGPYRRSKTGFSPSLTFCSKKFKPRRYPKHPLQITTRTPKRPDFKFELLPLHSPLLRQSLLVSFPPLIDMLKFSGYPYLIRGRRLECGREDHACTAGVERTHELHRCCAPGRTGTADGFKGRRLPGGRGDPQHQACA